MKAIALASLLSVAALTAGCSAFKSFSYSTPEGQTCLGMCEKARWDCRSPCGTNAVCLSDCEETAKACRKQCPPTTGVDPDSLY